MRIKKFSSNQRGHRIRSSLVWLAGTIVPVLWTGKCPVQDGSLQSLDYSSSWQRVQNTVTPTHPPTNSEEYISHGDDRILPTQPRSVYPSIHHSIHPLVCPLSIQPSIPPHNNPSARPSIISLSIHLSIFCSPNLFPACPSLLKSPSVCLSSFCPLIFHPSLIY